MGLNDSLKMIQETIDTAIKKSMPPEEVDENFEKAKMVVMMYDMTEGQIFTNKYEHEVRHSNARFMISFVTNFIAENEAILTEPVIASLKKHLAIAGSNYVGSAYALTNASIDAATATEGKSEIVMPGNTTKH